MDDIDKGILRDYLQNCRVTFQGLAAKYELSANAIKKRVRKLEQTGLISGYRVILSRAMFDAEFLFGLLTTDGSQDEEQFVNRLGESRYIIAAASYTDGHYALLAEYTSSTELWELGVYLRGLEGVENVELHPCLDFEKVEKIELSKMHRRILKNLVKNPRMSIADLAKATGLTAKRVRRLLSEMVESNSIRFSVGYELASERSVPFILRVTYDENVANHQQIVDWLNEQYSLSIWEIYISAVQSIIFVLFSAKDLNGVDLISRTTRRNEFVKSVKVIIAKHHKSFLGLRGRKLQELIAGVGDT